MTQAEIDRLRVLPVALGDLFIGGSFVPAADGATIDAGSPIDGQVFSTIAAGAVRDVDRAVAAARRSFEAGKWSCTAPAERKTVPYRMRASRGPGWCMSTHTAGQMARWRWAGYASLAMATTNRCNRRTNSPI